MKKINAPVYDQYYVDTGDGPTVLLLNGLFGNLKIWMPLIKVLKGDYRVIVPRLPIFDLPIEHTNVKYLAQVLNEFIEWHKLHDVILVGHAVGGQVALWYAHEHSNNVGKIVLTGSAGLFANPSYQVEHFSLTREYVEERVQDAFTKKEIVSDDLINDIHQTIQSIPKRLAINTINRSSVVQSVSKFLPNLKKPVLLLWGREDRITPPDVALHFHDLLQQSEVVFIEGAGHLPMLEQPELFTSNLIRFLKAIPVL